MSATEASALLKSDAKPYQEYSAARCTFLLLCFASLLDNMSRDIMGSLLRTFEMEFHANVDALGVLLLAGALPMALFSAVWGFLADSLSRKVLMVAGAAAWGAFTLLMAAAQSFWVLCVFRAFTGIALAAVTPLVQGLVIDLVPAARRGLAFGTIGIFGGVGTTISMGLAPNVGGSVTILGEYSGWRWLAGAVGVCSIALGGLILCCMREPPRTGAPLRLTVDEVVGVLRVLCQTPTFVLVLSQGLFGAVPWSALNGFLPLYLQYVGLSDMQTSLVLVARTAAGAFSNLIGGCLGDAAASRFPDTGRVRVAQISVASSLICVFGMLQLIPTESEYAFALYLFTSIIFGLLSGWCMTGVNQPLLADTVPEHMRATAMATEWGLESGSAAVLGGPLVGFLAEYAFDYHTSSLQLEETPLELRTANAVALREAMTWLTVVPWALCLACYSLVAYSYPRDRDRVCGATAAPSAPKDLVMP